MRNYFILFLCLFQGVLFAQWQDVGGGTNNSSHGMCVWNGQLVNVGSFNNPCGKVATWDESAWSCLGGGVGLVGRAAIEWNGNLIVVGDFWNNFQPCTGCNGIGVWDGSTWTPLGTGFNNDVLCLAIWNGDLVAGGDFTEADGQPCSRVARWDGTTWQPIGGPADFDNDIRCMIEFDGEFWVGGDFNNAGGCSACDGLVKWNGTNWVGGDSGVDIQGGVDSTVRVLYVNPSDGNLYMGGHFTDLSIDGVTTAFNGVAMYDGSDWTPLGTGVDSYVRAIHEYNGNLIVGGDFNTASGTSANKIAKWNPNTSTWSAMGTGMNGYVKSAAVYNGTFYAGGDFTTADGLSRDFIASWYETPSVPPVANMNNSANSACAGSCISFSDNSSNSPTSWTWSFPGATVTSSIAQNPGSICYSAAGNYTVTLEACNSSGCDITTQNITINSTPSVSFVNETICEGETAILTASPSTGGGSFVWTPGGATTQTISVNPSVTTNYSVTYTLNGCVSAAFNGSVTVNEVPTLTVTSGTTICSGNSVNLTATPSLAGGNFSWSPGGQTSGSVLVSPSSNTTYVVSYELNGCSAADASTTINVNTTPTLIVSDQTICNGSTATLSATPSSGGGSFLWSPGGETTSSIDVSPTATSNYSVVYTLNACPSTTENATVTVIAAPDVTINDAIICEGEDITISAVISDAGGSYLWSPGGETSSSITVFPSSDITYTVTYTITGCPPVTDDAVITVNETPTVTVNDELICSGETANLIANPSASGGSFLWSPGGETTNSIDVSPVTSDSYSVVYTLNGCESNAAVSSVTVNPVPDNSVLQNGFELSAVQNSATYQWLDCALYIPVSGATSQSFTPSSNGSYAVEINLNGCVDTSDCNVVAGLGTENQLLPSLLLYPNPANDVIHVIGSENALGYRIMDLQGKILLQGVLYDVITPINIEHLADGIYILETSGWSLQTIQFVKQ